ncbi:MAG: family 16 glycoside hydrolase, partial [Cytophagales bacterium]
MKQQLSSIKTTLLTLSICLLMGLAYGQNTLTKEEKKEGWKLLFDGKSLKGWHNFQSKTIGSAWSVTDGAIHLDKTV